MPTPVYRVTLGDRTVYTDEPRASSVVELTVGLDMDTPADQAVVVLSRLGGLAPEPGDEVTVELGWSGETPVQVLTGTVHDVETGLLHTRVVGHSPAQALLRTFVDETFEAKTAGAIARDLAGRAGVGVARAEDGIDFPAYVVDGRRSVYHHLRDLATLSGLDLYLDGDGEVVFEAFTGGRQKHAFSGISELVELESLASEPGALRIEAWGESPAGASGGGSWAWLTQDFAGAMGDAGGGEPVRLLERPALRTAAGADIAARAAQGALVRRSRGGRLVSPGRPGIRLGDAIQLDDTPEGCPEGLYQVRSVRHRLDRRSGFTTTVGFQAFEAGSSLAGFLP